MEPAGLAVSLTGWTSHPTVGIDEWPAPRTRRAANGASSGAGRPYVQLQVAADIYKVVTDIRKVVTDIYKVVTDIDKSSQMLSAPPKIFHVTVRNPDLPMVSV